VPAAEAGRPAPPQKLIEIFSRYQPKRELLVQIMEDAQKAFGWLSRDTIGQIAEFLSVSRERVVEAAAFYPVFRTEPPARYRVAVCRGESCTRKGSAALVDALARELHLGDGETSADGLFSLETVPCRGRCSESPVVSVNDRVLPLSSPDDLVAQLQRLAQDGRQP
jgi:NADH-quinone oxidoreductase subunit E